MYKVEISNGELIDKYTILLIKKDKIKDNYKLNKVNQEINILTNYIVKLNINFNLTNLINKLKEINSKLWNIEDNIRIKEKNKEFDDEFINLARSVYFTNDDRAKIKLEINNITKSEIIEVKSYEKYD
tara:strand:- start:635 stop:1018 length:384 start_codon:yes stop_codon:yes gene_type:complete